MKLKLGLIGVLVAVGATAAMAADADIIVLRQNLMKTNGQAAKVVVSMLKGEMPFNAEVAAAAAMSIAHDNEVFPSLFPAGTDTGETKAKAEIWSDPEGFKAASEALVAVARAAAEAAAQSPEAFGTAFQVVGKACGACHEKYRQSE